MSEENISLFELLNLSIGTTERGSVNFSALYALLLAVLKQLGVLEVKTQWGEPHPGYTAPHASVDVDGPPEEEEEVLADTEADQKVQQRREGSDPDGDERLRSRIQTCEDGLSQAMELIKELMEQKEVLKETMEELQQQQKTSDTRSDVDQCRRRVDALQEAVSSLRETLQKYPEPEELSQRDTWTLNESDDLKKPGDTNDLNPAMPVEPSTGPPPIPRPLPDEHVATPAAPRSPNILNPQEVEVSVPPGSPSQGQDEPPRTPEPQTEGDPTKISDPVAAHLNLSQEVGGSAWYQETTRNINVLQVKLSQVEAHMAALEEQKVDQNQLAPLRELISTSKGWQDAGSSLREQLDQQRALIQSLMSDREKEDTLVDLMSPDTKSSSEETPEGPDTGSKGLQELRQQVSYLRKWLQELEEDVKHLRSKQALLEERSADQNLQGQLDDLRGTLEDTMLSLTSQLSIRVQEEAEHGQNESQAVSERAQMSAVTSRDVTVNRKLGLLFQRCEQLQDAVNDLIWQQNRTRTRPPEVRQASRDSAAVRQNVLLVSDVQEAILKLQAECEELQETSRSLREDSVQNQNHIEQLFKTTEELEEKKADKQMVESEIKADKSALENKVSRLQFDSMTEQLNAMFHELLNKVTGQEQDWHQVVDRLSTEMECKLNRMELDSVKKQLEDRWKSIYKKLQAQSAPEHENAAAIRKQLVERFHCLSCDRPILRETPGPMLVTLPSFPAFRSRRSMKPYGVEQLRQQSKSLKPGTSRYNFQMPKENMKGAELRGSIDSCMQIESVELQRRLKNKQNPAGVQHERFSEPTNYLVMPRSCGGSHTVTSCGQRRSGLQHNKLLPQAEADGVSQEFGIIGQDGRIYKGRLNVQAMKNTETKLPIIPSKDCEDEGLCRTKDKARSSASQRPPASPEVGHNTPVHLLSAKSISRPASSCSGRDWPVSALGCCTSQSSVSQASAAAGSSSDPQSDDPMNL